MWNISFQGKLGSQASSIIKHIFSIKLLQIKAIIIRKLWNLEMQYLPILIVYQRRTLRGLGPVSWSNISDITIQFNKYIVDRHNQIYC